MVQDTSKRDLRINEQLAGNMKVDQYHRQGYVCISKYLIGNENIMN